MKKLQVGDYARNKIHGHTVFIFAKNSDFCYSLIIEVPNGIGENGLGSLHIEVATELERVDVSSALVEKTRTQIHKLYAEEKLDNLSYIEQLHFLNEAQKELENENQLSSD